MGSTYGLDQSLGLRAQNQRSYSSTDACFVIVGLLKKRRRGGMSSAIRFDILLAHGIHAMAFDMYPDVSWCKRWLPGHVLGLGYQPNDYMSD